MGHESFSVFWPSSVSTFYERFPSSRELETNIRDFCEALDSYRCANELNSFVESYKHFNTDLIHDIQTDSDDSDVECEVDISNEIDDDVPIESPNSHNSLTDCLKILRMYNIDVAYPNLCRVYSIAVAIPVTSLLRARLKDHFQL